MANKYFNYTEQQLENLINSVYGGRITPYNLPKDLYEATLNALANAIFKGFGANIADVQGFGDVSLLTHFLHNDAVFSAAKTFQNINDMSAALFDEEGVRVPFSQFKVSATNIFETYNVNWLEAEFNTATNAAFAGREWNGIVEASDSFPLLKYVTVGDDRVRDEHGELEGLILPVDDPLWGSIYPPNGFNCRCGVEQMEAGAKISVLSKTQREMLKPDPLFDYNPGKDKVIFKPDHPYTKVSERYEILKKDNFGLPIPPNPKDYIK